MLTFMRIEEDLFFNYLHKNNLRCSGERRTILKIFLDSEEHLTLEDILTKATKINPKINNSTIYRNMEILAEIGLANKWKGPDKKTYYEHKYKHPHHDHLICTKCGKIAEFYDQTIEKMQEATAKKLGFITTDHKLILYGLCKKCQ